MVADTGDDARGDGWRRLPWSSATGSDVLPLRSCSPIVRAGGTAISPTRVVGETGNNLIEAIGVLGWLDTALPAATLALVCGAVGAARRGVVARWSGGDELGGGTAPRHDRRVVDLRAVSGQHDGHLLAGPLLAAAARRDPAAARRRPGFLPTSPSRVARCAGCIALVVVNVAAWAAARRWGVGTHGSLMPWDWDTIHTPVPPIVVLAALAALSIGLVAALWRTVQPAPARVALRLRIGRYPRVDVDDRTVRRGAPHELQRAVRAAPPGAA